jgi:hypothetical protein
VDSCFGSERSPNDFYHGSGNNNHIIIKEIIIEEVVIIMNILMTRSSWGFC